jgi:hypothetical protein
MPGMNAKAIKGNRPQQRGPQQNKQKTKSIQPEERKLPPTIKVGRTARDDLRLFTPLFPVSTRKKLMYYETFQLSGTAGVMAQYTFSANGCYDPNISGVGHQPLGWDDAIKYYEQATVIKSKISVRGVGNGSQPVVLSVCLAPDTTTSVLPDVVENGLSVTTVLDGRANGGYGTGERIKDLDLNCDVAKYFGRPNIREIVDDPNLYCTSAANPTEQVYYLVNTWGQGTFSDNTNASCEAIIEFDVIFWEPRKVAAEFRKDTRSAVYMAQKMSKRSSTGDDEKQK